MAEGRLLTFHEDNGKYTVYVPDDIDPPIEVKTLPRPGVS